MLRADLVNALSEWKDAGGTAQDVLFAIEALMLDYMEERQPLDRRPYTTSKTEGGE